MAQIRHKNLSIKWSNIILNKVGYICLVWSGGPAEVERVTGSGTGLRQGQVRSHNNVDAKINFPTLIRIFP